MAPKQAFIFIGKSGCGKGTQAKLFQEAFLKKHPEEKIIYEETGALFRAFIQKETYTAQLARKIMEAGERQPGFLAIYMWGGMLIDVLTENDNVIMDGLPRSLHEAPILDTAMRFYNLNVTIVYINITDEEAARRLLARARADDDHNGVEKRLAWFGKDVMPAIEWYRAHPAHTFLEINGEQAPEAVHQEILLATNLI